MSAPEHGFLARIAACNLPPAQPCMAFHVAGHAVGVVADDLAGALAELPGLHRDAAGVHLAPPAEDFAGRSAALAGAHEALAAAGLAPPPRGELFPVTLDLPWRALCAVDRGFVPSLGLRAFGQHVNGWVRRPDGGLQLWLGRRARDRENAPGRLDNLAAGGLPHGIGLAENLVKECWEEAAIPAQLARRAMPVGYVAYRGTVRHGLRHDILYCYDLELPTDFTPRCNDGEVERFERVDVEEVARLVAETEAFKPNCNLVVIDFLVRHGLYRPEDPGYREVVAALRQGVQRVDHHPHGQRP
jgi:8-oxo-dGTP pyrophosphatase MutT (NUDIX family)